MNEKDHGFIFSCHCVSISFFSCCLLLTDGFSCCFIFLCFIFTLDLFFLSLALKFNLTVIKNNFTMNVKFSTEKCQDTRIAMNFLSA